ncbi:FAD-binding oxidoreductase [Acuticoccus sp. I52.16.1]|uniref:FAD-binding oxidoreductase n=1 Tax=Acuticoccus sp. I52.16.1 TaxID=2928472 RepID=UPI001FD2652B|nr:FAD-binding oxidoreductase [Acuticoccus sp. I52.16.1]UOM33040.1 FAD-binding oxidoreductase [Acuticoccus sp. I52.16.1]
MSDVSTETRPSALGAFRDAIVAELGPDALLDDPARMAPYQTEWRNLYQGKAPFVLRPRDTDQVSAIMRLAARHAVPIVPQGGNTGLVGGQIPREGEVVLSLDRMTAIEPVNVAGTCVTVSAGAILSEVHDAADAAGLMFPLSLASKGSARIGGLISTNAGGVGVLAYGNMRNQVLGLEVVLPDGRVWNGLRALHKDNVGYDLKHLFIGAEGTLGVVTRAVLKLVPKPHALDVAMVGVASPADALALLGQVRGALGDALTGFELIPRIGLEIVARHRPETRQPFAETPEWAVLIEASTFLPERPMRDVLEQVLMRAYEQGLVSDAVVSQSLGEARELWQIRELMSESQSVLGGSIKHDVSVPVADVPAFLTEATAAALSVVPAARPVAFGHLGDGNIHYNLSQPEGADKAGFLARWEEVNEAVHAVVRRYGGSIAAEHGVGVMKRALLPSVRDEVELAMMRAVKDAFDPDDLMNPGRLLPDR